MPAKKNSKPTRKKTNRAIARKQRATRLRSADLAGQWFVQLVRLQARLRALDGCPWDKEQTHLTLRTYLIEEAYEVLEALESGDDLKFAEELGDLLLQVVFHAQIASEQKRFTAADVVREIHQKMVRRHPHVFGAKRAKDAAEVLKNWEQLKAEERRAKAAEKGTTTLVAPKEESASLLDGIPHTLPAVMQGFQLTRRASRIGFDWETVEGVVEKLQEELEELRVARASQSSRQIEDEIGDVLFAAVNLARFLKVDPEIALKQTNAKFIARFQKMEQLARESGRKLAEVPRLEMEALWDRVKSEESLQAQAPRRVKKAAVRG